MSECTGMEWSLPQEHNHQWFWAFVMFRGNTRTDGGLDIPQIPELCYTLLMNVSPGPTLASGHTEMLRAQQEQPPQLPGAMGQPGWRKEPTWLAWRATTGWLEEPAAIVVVTQRYGLPVRKAALLAPPAQHRLPRQHQDSTGTSMAPLGTYT